MAAYCPAGCYCRGEGTECPLFTGAFNNWCGQECSCPQGFYCEFNEFPKACRHGYYTECQTVSSDQIIFYCKCLRNFKILCMNQIGGTPGAGSMDECIPCPAGTAVNLATPGYAGPENCVNCQPGSFRIGWKTLLATASGPYHMAVCFPLEIFLCISKSFLAVLFD